MLYSNIMHKLLACNRFLKDNDYLSHLGSLLSNVFLKFIITRGISCVFRLCVSSSTVMACKLTVCFGRIHRNKVEV